MESPVEGSKLSDGFQDAPHVPPEPLSYYSHKRAASDIKELGTQLGATQAIVGGHDWYRNSPWN